MRNWLPPTGALSPAGEYVGQVARIASSYTSLSGQPHHEGRLHRAWLCALRALRMVRDLSPPAAPEKPNGENEPT